MKQINLQQILDLSNYATETRVNRRKTGVNTNEFFTPYSIIMKMCDKISEEDWSDPEKTFCEPCFGNGQFILAIIYKRLIAGVDLMTTLKTLFGVELMEDNVLETKDRILDMLDKMEIEYHRPSVMKILNKNLVCSDFFKWDFENWCPIKECTSESIKLF